MPLPIYYHTYHDIFPDVVLAVVTPVYLITVFPYTYRYYTRFYDLRCCSLHLLIVFVPVIW